MLVNQSITNPDTLPCHVLHGGLMLAGSLAPINTSSREEAWKGSSEEKNASWDNDSLIRNRIDGGGNWCRSNHSPVCRQTGAQPHWAVASLENHPPPHPVLLLSTMSWGKQCPCCVRGGQLSLRSPLLASCPPPAYSLGGRVGNSPWCHVSAARQ